MNYSKKVTTNTKTHYAAASLKFAHRWLLTRVRVDLSEEDWFNLMLKYGLEFATTFSKMFGEKQQATFDKLTKASPKKGEPYNWFWMWWKLQWMQDDFDFIDQKIYKFTHESFTYEYYKKIMLESSTLEEDLLHQLQSH